MSVALIGKGVGSNLIEIGSDPFYIAKNRSSSLRPSAVCSHTNAAQFNNTVTQKTKRKDVFFDVYR